MNTSLHYYVLLNSIRDCRGEEGVGGETFQSASRAKWENL